MKILITSGGTSEPIDQVREITNKATGQLGKIIAETALEKGHDVTLVTTKLAQHPLPHPRLNMVIVSNVASLLSALEPLVKTHDALIHAMAVSDYSPVYMTDLDTVEASPSLRDFLQQSNTETKISSSADYQVLFLKKTPKIISLVKTWQPAIKLVGFKLLVNVSTEELISVASNSLNKNQADYILANDLITITETQHLAYLVGPNQVEKVETKHEIAQLILNRIEGR